MVYVQHSHCQYFCFPTPGNKHTKNTQAKLFQPVRMTTINAGGARI
jgi:hypothetical protein